MRINKPVAANQKTAKKTTAARMAKPLVPAPAAESATVRSLFYVVTRGTPFYSANLREKDFTAQKFEAGRLGAPVACVATHGAQGDACSLMKVKNNVADLQDGRLFDLSGIKKREIVPLGAPLARWAAKHGQLHTLTMKAGAHKGTHQGYVIGNTDNMCLGFVTKDGKQAWTLNTRTLPKGRNADRVFVLEK